MRKALFLALLLASSTAQAGSFFNGNQMYNDCQDNRLSAAQYAAGVSDALDMAEELSQFNDGICYPKNVVVRQVLDISCNYLQAHPEKRQYAASSLIIQALQEAFPCN